MATEEQKKVLETITEENPLKVKDDSLAKKMLEQQGTKEETAGT